MKTNFHTHTQRCGHARGTALEYVQSAIRSGLSQLGFSDHGPFPDKDYCARMPFAQFQDYLTDMDELRARFSDRITLWKGVEIEYLPEYHDFYEALLTKYGLDYLLLGQHFYRSLPGEIAFTSASRSTEDYLNYAKAAADGMKTGYFAAVAHPDIYMMNPYSWDDNCLRAADILIGNALATDTILEYNANGLRRGITAFPDGERFPYPHPRFWEMAASAKVRVIVGSDCHAPELVWDKAVEQSYQQLKALGLRPLTHPLCKNHPCVRT